MRWAFNMGTRPSKNGYKAIADTNVIFLQNRRQLNIMRTVRFSEKITVIQQVEEFYVMRQEPITGEDQIASRNLPFQRKRIKMKALLRLKHLERKERRKAAKKKGEKDSSSRIWIEQAFSNMMSVNIRAKQWMITAIVYHLKKGDLSEMEIIANLLKTKASNPRHVFLETVHDPSGTFTLFHFMCHMEIMRLALRGDDYVTYSDWVFCQQSQHTPGWGILLRTVKSLFLVHAGGLWRGRNENGSECSRRFSS